MIVPVVAFLAALAAGLYWDRRGLRWILVIAIILAPVRGGLLALADDVNLGNSGLAVNALVPALVAALTVGVLIRLRPRPRDLPKALLIGWVLIAVAAVVNLAAEKVGLKLYGVGLAQYLVYPTMVIAAWPLYEEGDLRKLSRLLIAMGVVVAITVLMQALGVEGFIQAASAEVEGLAANRYAGITGSYLHTSAFLGVIAVLVMGELLNLRKPLEQAAGSLLLTLILCGEILTFSRSGIVIAGLGLVVFLALIAVNRRVIFVAMVVPAVGVALLTSTLVGHVDPTAQAARITGAANPTGDQGNSLRTEAFGDGLERFKSNGVAQEALGEGLGSTGNARKLVSGQIFAVESFYLKLLVETGVFGLIAIGGFFVWAMFYFAREIWFHRKPWFASVATAALGLSLYNVIYPALETQILALVWWLLLAMCLRGDPGGNPAPEVEADEVQAGSGARVLVTR